MKNNNFNKIKIMIILIYLKFLNFDIKMHLYIDEFLYQNLKILNKSILSLF